MSKPLIELPRIKHSKSGLQKMGKTYRVLYYQDGKLRGRTIGFSTTLSEAIKHRDSLHKQWIGQGAVYKGGTRRAIEDAKKNPKGMACIYESLIYKVKIDGVHVITTTDKERAISARNKYIRKNH